MCRCWHGGGVNEGLRGGVRPRCEAGCVVCACWRCVGVVVILLGWGHWFAWIYGRLRVFRGGAVAVSGIRPWQGCCAFKFLGAHVFWHGCVVAWCFRPGGLAVTLVCLLLCSCCVPCFVHWFRTAARAVIPCLCPYRAGAFQSYPLFLTTTLFPCSSHALPSLSGSFSLFWIAPVQAGHL